MPPTTGRDFLEAARRRLDAAEHLHAGGFHLDAQYLGGYTVECSLKALIVHHTPDPDKPATLAKITAGAAMHRPDVLIGKLRSLDVPLPDTIEEFLGGFAWATDFRYETGPRDAEETTLFLATARSVFNWAERDLT